jgi:hypothetical protein
VVRVAEDDQRNGDYTGPPNSSYDPFAQPTQGFPALPPPSVEPPYAPQPPYVQPSYAPQPPYVQPSFGQVPMAPAPFQPYPAMYPPDPYGSYPQPSTRNGLAIASLVCSLLGLCCGIGALVGLGLGIAGLNQSKQLGSGRGLAIAGIAVGVFGVFEIVGWLILIAVNFNG